MPMNSSESPSTAHQQSHRHRDQTARLQRDQRAHGRAAGDRREPLPRINSRFGHPTPQNGVEVERKWKRPDYRIPGVLPADAQGIGTHGPAHRFTVLPPDPRVVCANGSSARRRKHAQAVLAAYDLLQALHDRGILDVATSAMAASDELLEKGSNGSTRRERSARCETSVLAGGLEASSQNGSRAWFQAIPEGSRSRRRSVTEPCPPSGRCYAD